jgi:hypothetical protein
LTISFKDFDQSTDVSIQRSAVNEVIPLTGTFFSGSTEYYTKNYLNITSGSVVSGGFWKTVYDGSPSSISSSALVDITYGHSSQSLNAGYSETFLNTEKQRVYQQMAGMLLGSKSSIFNFNSTNYHELFFVLFKRRIFKDEVKKGNVSLTFDVTGSDGDVLALTDAGAASSFTIGSAGDEASIYSGSTEVGKMYYNAGIAVFVTGVFLSPTSAQSINWSGSAGADTLDRVAISGNIDHIIYGFKNRVVDFQFINQTNLHSTIYFCRALNADFNYSTNPTFTDSDDRIIPTSGTDNQTRTYITTIGLYDINDNMLAVSKLSEPVKKSPETEVIFRVRLSY